MFNIKENVSADPSCLSSIEQEHQQVKELEAQRNRLDQETSAKLAELNNR